jgi:hypothetical protein
MALPPSFGVGIRDIELDLWIERRYDGILAVICCWDEMMLS